MLIMGRPLFIFLLFSVAFQAISQESLRSDIYACFISGDISKWEEVVSNHSLQDGNPDYNYEYALAYYGIVGYYVRNGLRQEGREYLAELVKITDILLEASPEEPRFLALKGATYGYEMFFNRHRIFSLGPKSMKVIDRAVELGPGVPHALIEDGNKTFHMPRFLGGSKEEAIRLYHIAINAMEEDPSYIKENWFYLNALTVLAGYYEQVGLTNRAKGLYVKINQIEPEYKIIKIRIESLSNQP